MNFKISGRVDRVLIGQSHNGLPVGSVHKVKKNFRGPSVRQNNLF